MTKPTDFVYLVCSIYLLSGLLNAVLTSELQNAKTASDCEANDGIHKNNTEWNPVMRNIRMKCITCTCLNGVTDCQDIQCPVLNCKRKSKVKGKCCKVCRKGKRNKKGRKGRKGKKRKRSDEGKCKNTKRKQGKEKDKKERRKRRPKVNRRGHCLIENKDVVASANLSLPDIFSKRNNKQHCIFKKLCLPKDTKYLVYRHLEENSKAFFAFDDLKSDTVDVWLWTVNKTEDAKSHFKHSLSDFQELKYPAKWFRQQIADDNMIFGAARRRKVNLFQRRLKRTYTRCIEAEKKKRCTTKILMQEILCADFEEIYRKCD